MRPARLLAAVLAAGVMLVAPAFLRINFTRSLPVGLYALASDRPIRGSLVEVCPPAALARQALARRFLSPGRCPAGTEPLLKILAGEAGDQVAVDSAGVLINGLLLDGSAPLALDRFGRPLLPTSFHGRIPAGYVWLQATHPRSWDSRYFGPVPRRSITAVLRPLLTVSLR